MEMPRMVNHSNTWKSSMRTLKRTHSFQNNYDKDVQCKKQDYTFILDDLCNETKSEVRKFISSYNDKYTFNKSYP